MLSDLRKFFTELRTNLDSVEEVAALSQEQGLPINPEDFLALLAQHEGSLIWGVTLTHFSFILSTTNPSVDPRIPSILECVLKCSYLKIAARWKRESLSVGFHDFVESCSL